MGQLCNDYEYENNIIVIPRYAQKDCDEKGYSYITLPWGQVIKVIKKYTVEVENENDYKNMTVEELDEKVILLEKSIEKRKEAIRASEEKIRMIDEKLNNNL